MVEPILIEPVCPMGTDGNLTGSSLCSLPFRGSATGQQEWPSWTHSGPSDFLSFFLEMNISMFIFNLSSISSIR